MCRNDRMYHCIQRVELLFEHWLFSHPIFYCQDLGQETSREHTCASLK